MADEGEGGLRDLEHRLHVFEGLVRVLDDVHLFLEVVLAGADPGQTVTDLRAALGLSEVQATAALAMQFRRLGRSEQGTIRSELDEMRLERDRTTGA